ncbi:hypothetical protein B0T18DRAFT_256177 [Schizothecium vesticola]|uniref:Protein kinase domain-containing protein n=1 Tax=Schizothecium vesticola TaxID=314040 RepID=A0AA40BRG9_9PEZI|nr:hypothetical protein B0T18DRAFT_256177 [Schizothecium vesticola]
MESLMPLAGRTLGVQRRLSRLYNDTKKSSDFVKDPVQSVDSDPEIKSLHRKLRIQKDRLVSWGLEWSDPSQQASAELLIDPSLNKAGLSEVVGSIMSTIKDILAEAEPLWHSSRRLAGEHVDPEQAARRGEKIQLVVWDKPRFEDLVRDLTTSIDTLYDLSRTRSSYAQSSAAARERMSKSSSSAEDLRPFESSRIHTPQQIDPANLTNLRAIQAVPMTELAERERRDVVFMDRQAYATLMQGLGGQQSHAPLLLEYATFDSIYSLTGISPPMDRFGKLSAGLQAESPRVSASWTGLPRLLGYFEDMDNSRFGLVYQFPKTFNPVTFEHLTQNPLYNLCSLTDLLVRPDFEPKLEAKFRLAANLANTVFDLHSRGITHGNLLADNVSFCNAVGTDPEVSGITQGEVDIRRPLVSAFDLFSDPMSQDEPKVFSLYKHPLDPRNSSQSPLASHADSKTFDLYSLAMILLSVGLWTKLEDLVPSADSPTIPESILEKLAIRCGTLYMKAVQACWNAVDQEVAGSASADRVASRAQVKASRYLEACCILDGVSNLEERLGDDFGEPRPDPARLSTASAASITPKNEKSAAGSTQTTKEATETPPVVPAIEPVVDVQAPATAEAEAKKASTKTRLYPHVLLAPEVVEQWNTVLMPEINTALKHFYRKNPESVEISLESIGESPQVTKPTVLVICTSVSKVRAILKKKMGVFFEGNGALGLKVCRGQVLRSRHDGVSPGATNAGDASHDKTVAANREYQEKPRNGASIGAWIGDRHLPPVSLGGLIVVDDKSYGMTVHHMLDDPEQTMPAARDNVSRSGAGREALPDLHAWYAQQYQTTESDHDSSSGSEGYSCEFSESDSDAYSESAITSDDSDDDDDEEEYGEIGDIPGIEPGCGDDYIITQPALDDVPEGFYPSAETQDEDHLYTYGVGEMFASSGIRRRAMNGLVHEIDWALFEFKEERQPEGNSIPRLDPTKTRRKPANGRPEPPPPRRSSRSLTIQPTMVAPSHSLPGLEVQCMARTSGLKTGTILQTVASIKIAGRATPSHIYQVSGTPSGASPADGGGDDAAAASRSLAMGIPGDSGAWVVERRKGIVCGHVLAWSERKRVAYICPMDVMLVDMAETLDAGEIRLPGGEVLVSSEAVPDEDEPKPMAGMESRRGSVRTQKSVRVGSLRLSQIGRSAVVREESVLREDNEGDGDNEVSSDEGVEVGLAQNVKQMGLSGAGRAASREELQIGS